MSQPSTFLLFSIGPVQEFIAAARKTRDLFAGSMMLSYLSSKAIQTILDEAGKKGHSIEMMFPHVTLQDLKDQDSLSDSSIPNRFLVDVTNYPFDAMSVLAEKAKSEVQKEFERIGGFAKQMVYTNSADQVWETFWHEQLNNFIECNWVLIRSNDLGYGNRYREVEQFSGKRKLLREFNELKFYENCVGQPGIKCTIIPNLSAVHPGSKNPKEFWQEHARDNPGDFRKSERLSAIAITKRHFIKVIGMDDVFPSTTTLAAGMFNHSLIIAANQEPKLLCAIGNYVLKVQSLVEAIKFPKKIGNYPLLERNNQNPIRDYLGLDSDWLYDYSYEENVIEKEYGIELNAIKRTKLNEAKVARQALFMAIKEYNSVNVVNTIPTVSKYYAILFFDGDNMGKWLSGSIGDVSLLGFHNKQPFVIEANVHKTISKKLRLFSTPSPVAENVYKIVEEKHLGKVIYSGGDDVIAFVALSDCFKVAKELRAAFTLAMGYREATGSLGMAIAHHQMNLQQVLQEVRNAEHYAKNLLDRDAVAFALLKRSGEHSTCGAKWYPKTGEGTETDTMSALKEFASLITNKTISTKFIYDLENERIGLEGVPEAIPSEINRLLMRHSRRDSKQTVSDFFNIMLSPFYKALEEENKKVPIRFSALEQLINLLEVAQFIAQGGER